MNKYILAVIAIASVTALCTPARAGEPIAPAAPFSANADSMAANWSKLFKKHISKDDAVRMSCAFPTEAAVGVKPYPGSLALSVARGGGSAGNGNDVPMVELVTKTPLPKVIAWYKKHYPGLKAKRIFETAGPGINYLTHNAAQSRKHPADVEVELDGNHQFIGCSGLLEAPASYRTAVRIYYRPHGK